ncbi:MAG: hypothetical protein ABFS12_01260 [Bacteroidota bacterium]
MQLLKKFISIIIPIMLFTGCAEKEERFISFDDDGMLRLKGDRTFIIGSYHHPKTENPFHELSANGYNYVHVSPDKAILDSAANYNLMSWITTGIVNDSDKSDTMRIAELVNNYMDHPSLLFWEIADEPAFNWNTPEPRITHKKMLEAYSLIKSRDQKHLVFTNHGPVNLISTLQKYNLSTDIVGVDVYPVIPHGITPTYAIYPDGLQGDLLNPYISQVGEYTDKMKKVVNNSKPVFLVLQGFSWEMLKPSGERDLSMIQYPTYEESRFMAYNAIVHGANGILYWGTNYTPQPSQFIDDLNKVTKELAEMQDVLASKTAELKIKKEYHELMYSVDTGVEIMVKKVNGKTYMLTINSDKNPVKVTFSGLSGLNEASVLSEKRKLEITDGKFIDSYKPFDVHIYEIK